MAQACGSGGEPAASADGSNDGELSDATSDEAALGDASASDSGILVQDATSEASTASMTDASGSASSADAPESSEASDGVEAGPYLGSQTTAATTALLRFANWSPDEPAFDLCLAPHGTPSFQGPLLYMLSDAGASGLAFPLVSAYTLVAPGQYDARVVVGGATSCAVGIRDDSPLPPLPAGAAQTIAVVGEASPSIGDAKLQVVGFFDDVASTGPNVPPMVRVINAAAALPEIDVGTGSVVGKSFLSIFRGVFFGLSGGPSGAWIPALVDSNGYTQTNPLAGASVSAHATGTTADAVITSDLTIAKGVVMTIVVAGGTSSTPPTIVTCADNAGTTSFLSDCDVFLRGDGGT
jgi:hypothetical protein